MNAASHYTRPVDRLEAAELETLVDLALAEDAPAGDATSDAIFAADHQSRARIVARESGIVCGLPALQAVCKRDRLRHPPGLELVGQLDDGQAFAAGQSLMEFRGPTRTLLRLERVLLNFLQYLCGIATATAAAVAQAPAGLAVLDTRKTLPGYRRLAKYAVYCGGGSNHRLHLSEMAMIKDNHIAAAGSLSEALRLVRKARPGIAVEVEVDTMLQLAELLPLAPDFVLLDNMDDATLAQAVEMTRRLAPGTRIEVSGGWRPEQLKRLQALCPLGVSMGFLTHTTRFLDLSMEFLTEPVDQG
ncbi:MAG: carboxylating nicotinate-nucleotide diphosphorylase [Leptospirales bacterium]|nr:carboxylating nicotinate-nucleotide diphosphorylase [Leptospirales bacterium]